MKQFIKNNWSYYLLYLIVLCWTAYYLFQFDKVTLHLKINACVGNPAIDTFFKYFTHVGDGIFAVFLGLIVLIVNIRKGIFVLCTYIVSGLFTSLLKNYCFNINRPHFVFDYFVHDAKVKYIEGVDMVGLNSFPSGHATSAFAVFTCMALISNNPFLKFIFFILALVSAFSRTYLSQHWLVDITVGSMIGTAAATLFFFIFMHRSRFQKLDKPLFNFKRP
ncbi:MAG: phosphatase PAP2 family protein [Bacteroidota bacterium]|nr:phosphatase PAP2 family protein [Bacteroidota bacterium]